ncbi:hypothetical protein Tco_0790971 [Tanacetum coccineum]
MASHAQYKDIHLRIVLVDNISRISRQRSTLKSTCDHLACDIMPLKPFVFQNIPTMSEQTIVYAPQWNNMTVDNNYPREFWITTVAYHPFPSTDETEQRPLREFLIKFLVSNGFSVGLTPLLSTAKTTSRPEGPIGDKDSGGNKTPADMKPINPTDVDPSGTGAKYQVDQTQSTRLSSKNKDGILGASEEVDEDSQTAAVQHHSSPPQADKPQSSIAPSTEASDTNFYSGDILRKYRDTFPLTEQKLVKYLRKASIDDYYEENIAHRDQNDKLVEATMSSLDKISITTSDVYKGLNIITKLLKEINNDVKDDPAMNKKISEATETFTKYL